MMSLVPPRKRKDANALLLTRDKARVRIIGPSADRHSSGSTKTPHGRANNPASRTFTNLRRGSLRIFSIFRNGKSSTPSSGEITSSSTGSTVNTPDGTHRAETAKPDTDPSLHCHAKPDVPITLPTLDLPTLDLRPRSSSMFPLTTTTGFDGESDPVLRTLTPPPTPLVTSWSTPSLSQQLTAKLSNVLLQNNDTVVHRPKLHSRPTVRTDQFKQPSDDQITTTSPKTPMSEVPSLPSSVLSPGSSNAPLSQSTAPTSHKSSAPPTSGETTHRGYNSRQVTDSSPPLYESIAEQMPSHFLVFPRQDAPRLSEPSVATTENAAAAKVFFESHFNQILGTKVTPRSMRRRQMERKLFAMAIPNEHRHHKRRE
ncbi:hypothetical protein EJ02DRAFT_244232 [Clathrospora elynae]|uniref:Uncharacterized protein n=1 Tax=Clathrospora elynae TaxID=706981 RepID=A0A6A5SJN4_9PLEO|nr:hypothetical protein EJ02DRAFT_244232 [Clathrospora elynae]